MANSRSVIIRQATEIRHLLTKSASADEIAEAIASVMQGKLYRA